MCKLSLGLYFVLCHPSPPTFPKTSLTLQQKRKTTRVFPSLWKECIPYHFLLLFLFWRMGEWGKGVEVYTSTHNSIHWIPLSSRCIFSGRSEEMVCFLRKLVIFFSLTFSRMFLSSGLQSFFKERKIKFCTPLKS